MSIQYIAPLETAYGRMKRQLFQPFDFSKWIVLGFSAWLARLGSGNSNLAFPPIGGGSDNSDAAELYPVALSFPDSGGVEGWILALVAFLVLFVVALVLLIAWVSARGQFVFLDNVIHERARIVAPWKEYRREGNSFFFWTLGFLAAIFLLILLVAAPVVLIAIRGGKPLTEVSLLAILILALLVFAIAVVAAYVQLFLIDFVVPVMYRERLTAMAAWRRFLPLLRANLLHFLLYGLFVLALHILLMFALLAVILLTCCIALIPLILPFVGTVMLLPVWVTLRTFSLEYLGQISPVHGFPPAPTPDTLLVEPAEVRAPQPPEDAG